MEPDCSKSVKTQPSEEPSFIAATSSINESTKNKSSGNSSQNKNEGGQRFTPMFTPMLIGPNGMLTIRRSCDDKECKPRDFPDFDDNVFKKAIKPNEITNEVLEAQCKLILPKLEKEVQKAIKENQDKISHQSEMQSKSGKTPDSQTGHFADGKKKLVGFNDSEKPSSSTKCFVRLMVSEDSIIKKMVTKDMEKNNDCK